MFFTIIWINVYNCITISALDTLIFDWVIKRVLDDHPVELRYCLLSSNCRELDHVHSFSGSLPEVLHQIADHRKDFPPYSNAVVALQQCQSLYGVCMNIIWSTWVYTNLGSAIKFLFHQSLYVSMRPLPMKHSPQCCTWYNQNIYEVIHIHTILVRWFYHRGRAWASMHWKHCWFNVLSWHTNHGICHCLLFHEHGKQIFVQPFLRCLWVSLYMHGLYLERTQLLCVIWRYHLWAACLCLSWSTVAFSRSIGVKWHSEGLKILAFAL